MRIYRIVLSVLMAGSSALGQTLRQIADKDGMLIGTAVRSTQLSEPAYATTLAREFNMVEAEDAMKWWVLRPDAQPPTIFARVMRWCGLHMRIR